MNWHLVWIGVFAGLTGALWPSVHEGDRTGSAFAFSLLACTVLLILDLYLPRL